MRGRGGCKLRRRDFSERWSSREIHGDSGQTEIQDRRNYPPHIIKSVRSAKCCSSPERKMNQDLQSAHEADQSQKNGTTHRAGQFRRLSASSSSIRPFYRLRNKIDGRVRRNNHLTHQIRVVPPATRLARLEVDPMGRPLLCFLQPSIFDLVDVIIR